MEDDSPASTGANGLAAGLDADLPPRRGELTGAGAVREHLARGTGRRRQSRGARWSRRPRGGRGGGHPCSASVRRVASVGRRRAGLRPPHTGGTRASGRRPPVHARRRRARAADPRQRVRARRLRQPDRVRAARRPARQRRPGRVGGGDRARGRAARPSGLPLRDRLLQPEFPEAVGVQVVDGAERQVHDELLPVEERTRRQQQHGRQHAADGLLRVPCRHAWRRPDLPGA